jgi:ABC-type transporter Mla subunit MlaD
MDALAAVWRTELAALRDEESARGQAAVERLETLQGTVAQHLASLGAALEAPLTRLLQTASDVPQAAAEVITQLRREMAHLSDRDNAALAERTAMMGQLGALLQAVNEATGQQRAAIESLVGSASQVLQQAGEQFAKALGAQAGKVDEVSAHVAASAVELSSLGESFGHGVGLFTASNEKLMDSLQRVESAIGQSLSRSDEQLAYYVAQAREVIDLSISSQQGIVEDLRRLHGEMAAAVQGVAA